VNRTVCRKRIAYQTVQVGTTRLKRVDCVVSIVTRLHAAVSHTTYTHTFALINHFEVFIGCTRVGTLVVATIYLQLIQNRYVVRSFTVLQCSHQHCVQPVASDVEVVGYL